MNDINMWKYNSRIGSFGFAATVALGFSITPQLGKDVHSHYLFDDLTMVSLLMFGTLFSAIGSYLHKKQEESTNLSQERLNADRTNLVQFSMIGAGCLIAAALYAFDVAFSGGSIYGSPRPNAGPETVSEKFLYSALYSFVALAGLLVAYAEGRSIKKELFPSNSDSSSENTFLISRSTRSGNGTLNRDFTPHRL